ncbi:Histidinol-phosphate aminotransferase [subsurface metagenome]
MNIRPAIRQLVRESYGAQTEPPKGNILDCAVGRNSFGTSEKVVEFAKHYDWSDLWQHPDTSYKDLKQEICNFWSDYADLKIANVKVANGSCVILSRFNKLFIEPGVKVLGYVPQFPEYTAEVAVLGGSYEAVPLDPQEGFKFNLDRLLGRIKPDYCIVYIDNPNNPTGQLISLSDIETIVRETRKKDIVVIIDEAYADYIEEKHSAVNLINQYKNLVVTRTFTKGYGIGRFRVGYAMLSTELGDYYNRIELPFSISTMGASLAREALLDQDFILNVRQQVKAEKEKLTTGLSERGYLIGETCESCPIFILGHKDKNFDLKDDFLSRGIYTLPGTEWENLGKNYVRVNTPPRAEDFLARLE